MDGRLSACEHERVERHVEGCSRCGEELESLRYTVSLLRRMPVRSPRRVFTLGEAPSIASTPWRVRVPVWAYGAAASVAIALFALVLSADLSGSLAQDESDPWGADYREVPIVTTPSPGPIPAPEAEKSAVLLSPTATPAPQPTSTPQPASMAQPTPMPQPTPTQEMAAAMELIPVVTPIPEATPMSGGTTEITDADDTLPYTPVVKEAAYPISTPPPIPMTGVAEAEGVGPWADTPAPADVATPSPVPQSGGPEKDAALTLAVPAVTPTSRPAEGPLAPVTVAAPPVVNQLDRSDEQGTTSIPTVAPSPTPTPAPTPDSPTQAGPTQEVSAFEAGDGSTALVWRVLEGVLGAAAVILVGGILWRVRHPSGRTTS